MISDMTPQSIIGSVSLQLPDSAEVQHSKISSLKRPLRNNWFDTIAALQKSKIPSCSWVRLRTSLPENLSCCMTEAIIPDP